jgi:hypothetical protein
MRRGQALADQWQKLAGVPPAPLSRALAGAEHAQTGLGAVQ